MKHCIRKIIDDEIYTGFRCLAPHFCLKGFPQDFMFRIWPLVPTNKDEQNIVIGQDTEINGYWMSKETIQEMFRNGPKHYMDTHITYDDEDSLSPLGTLLLERFSARFHVQNMALGTNQQR